MIILKCKICDGEMDLVVSNKSSYKKIKCNRCGFSNVEKPIPYPEVTVIRKFKKNE